MKSAGEVPDQNAALEERIESRGLASPIARSLRIFDCRCQFGLNCSACQAAGLCGLWISLLVSTTLAIRTSLSASATEASHNGFLSSSFWSQAAIGVVLSLA
jgi:hypothetical protein